MLSILRDIDSHVVSIKSFNNDRNLEHIEGEGIIATDTIGRNSEMNGVFNVEISNPNKHHYLIKQIKFRVSDIFKGYENNFLMLVAGITSPQIRTIVHGTHFLYAKVLSGLSDYEERKLRDLRKKPTKTIEERKLIEHYEEDIHQFQLLKREQYKIMLNEDSGTAGDMEFF